MSIYIVLVLILIPSRPGTSDMEQVMTREWVTASSALECQKHADKRAEEQRKQQAAVIQRLRARVVGSCIEHKESA